MNLYSNINSFSNFSGWGSSSGNTLDPSGWVPVSTPKVSDYVPSYTPAVPSAADYIRTQPVTEPSVTLPTSLEPVPVTETSLSGGRHYSVEELQQIGSGSKEEVVEFFKNIGGTATETIEEGRVFTGYSSPLLPGRYLSVNDRGELFWTTSYTTPPENDSDLPTLNLQGSRTITLTGSEIAAIINAQNNLPPQAEDYIPVETAPAAEGGNTELPINPLTETATVLRPDIVPAVPQPPAAVPAENTAAETPPAAPLETAVPAQTESGNAAAAESSAASPSADTASAQENVLTAENTAQAADNAQTQNPQSPAAEDLPQPDQADSTTASAQEDVAAENTAPAADGAQTQNPHPQSHAADTVGTATTLAQSALSNPHQELMAEAERLKNIASQKHDLASGFSQTIMEFEEGRIYDERRTYYANNREALNEAVEKIRADAAELTQKHGEDAGKMHFIGGAVRILGGVGSTIDAYELGSRINTAWKDGNWDPVAGQITKIAASAAAVSGSAAIARTAGLLLMGAGFSAGVVTAATLVVGVGLTIAALKGAEALDKEISNANWFDFSSNGEDKYTDLVLFGNHSYIGDTKLDAKNVTLIGNHRFENLEINSDETTIIGNIDSDGKFIIQANTVNVSDGKEISEDFARQAAGNQVETKSEAEPAAETPAAAVETPTIVTEPTEPRKFGVFEEAEINWDYVGAVTAQRQITVDEYYQSLIELPEIDEVVDQEMLDMIRQKQDAEWEKVLNMPAALEDPVLILPENPTYPDISKPEIQIQIQENPII